MTNKVGIEKINAYPCTLAIDMETLSIGRDHDPSHPINQLLVNSRSLTPAWEDPVTMAVNAARDLLTEEDRESIRLIIVATESSPDFGKPISTYVQRWANIQPNCRNFEVKHACYGGTGAVMMAAHWIASGHNKGAKALVVTTDQSRVHLGRQWEYVLGGGAVAMLISDKPDVLEFDLDKHGYWTTEVADTYRPTSTTEVGNADDSLFCYLDALEGAYDDFVDQVGEIDYDAYFKKNIYHVPFGGMTYRAHRTLLQKTRRMKASEARENFARKSKAALKYNAEFGGMYTSAIYLALAGLIDASEDLEPGDRIGIFSYGSGSCSEFYEATIGQRAKEVVAAARIQDQVDARELVSFDEYEALESARAARVDQPNYVIDTSGHNGLYERLYAGKQRLVLEGLTDFRRDYKLS